jgi:acyl carrier protein
VTDDELRETVVEALLEIAPEADPGALRPDVSLREQVDIDSMDFLNLVIALHERLRVDIPEADYQRLQSLDDLVAYLAEKTGA